MSPFTQTKSYFAAFTVPHFQAHAIRLRCFVLGYIVTQHLIHAGLPARASGSEIAEYLRAISDGDLFFRWMLIRPTGTTCRNHLPQLFPRAGNKSVLPIVRRGRRGVIHRIVTKLRVHVFLPFEPK